jgi:hypothetical protein
VLDRARAVDLGERERFARVDDDKWIDLPALAEVARGRRRASLVAMPPFPFSPVRFSGLIEKVLASESRYKLLRLPTRGSKELSCVEARNQTVRKPS